MVNTETLQFLETQPIWNSRPVLVISDTPLEAEMKSKQGFSAPSHKELLSSLVSAGIKGSDIQTTYLFNFRIPKGDIEDVFHKDGLPVADYISWSQSKRDSLLHVAYYTLANLRYTIKLIEPSLIICTGRWGLYFLSGETTFLETKKSPFGTLLKWRASNLQLGSFWKYDKPHTLVPIIPPSAKFRLPEYDKIRQQDFKRLGLVYKKVLQKQLSDLFVDESKFLIKPTFDQVKYWFFEHLDILNEAKNPVRYAVDIETRAGAEDCIGIAWSDTEAICLPFSTYNSPYYWTEEQEIYLTQLLRLFLNHPKLFLIGQNFSYDYQYIWRDLLVKKLPDCDTMILHHVMYAGLDKNLAFQASIYSLKYKFWKDTGKPPAVLSTGDFIIREDIDRWKYNCRDCCYTFEIASAAEDVLVHSPLNIQRAYKNQLRRVLPAVISMMDRGVKINTSEKTKLRKEFHEFRETATKDLNYIIGEEFNYASSDQKKRLLYDIFQLPVQFNPKTKQPATDAEALTTLGGIELLCRPIINRISELTQINTLVTTFLEARQDIDNRMRSSYGFADTFRFTSSKNAFGTGANLQNIPKANKTLTGKTLPDIRDLFIPDSGMTMFDIDLDSADLRIVTWLAGADNLKAMFAEGKKPYVEAMKEYFRDPNKSKHDKEYPQFKSTIHAGNYLGSAAGIASRVGLLVHEVDRLLKWWFGMNPEIKRWHEELRRQVHGRGWIENAFGYRKTFWNKNEPTIMQIAAAWNPQSTVAIYINELMCRIHEAAPQSTESNIQLLLQVHDSLVGQFPTELTEQCEARILKLAEIPLKYPSGELIIPAGIKTSAISWGQCG